MKPHKPDQLDVDEAAKLPALPKRLADYSPELAELELKRADLLSKNNANERDINKIVVERSTGLSPSPMSAGAAELLGDEPGVVPNQSLDARLATAMTMRRDIKSALETIDKRLAEVRQVARGRMINALRPLHEKLGRQMCDAFVEFYNAALPYRDFHLALMACDATWPTGGMAFAEGDPRDWQSGFALFLRRASEAGFFDIADMPPALCSPHEAWLKRTIAAGLDPVEEERKSQEAGAAIVAASKK